MRTFSKDTRMGMFHATNGYCQCSITCAEKITQYHHMLPNTKVFNKLYPLFLHSPFNCCPINHDCHANKPKRKISESLAAVYERYLERISK